MQKNNMQKKDKENLRQVILDFPFQFEKGFDLAKNIKISKKFQSVCISGMGGSSLPVDVLKSYLRGVPQEKKDPDFPIIYRNRDYHLPPEAYKNCLNIFISYSGNTEETLSSLNEALKKNLLAIGITNGGKLEKICQKNNLPLVIIPKISQPRYALGYFFSVLLQILSNQEFLKDDFKEISQSIKQLRGKTIALEKEGKNLAKKLFGKTPIIHTSDKLKSVGRIWKIKINENAKTPAFSNFYPEVNHNEMVGFTLPQGKFHIINLVDSREKTLVKRMELTAKILKKRGIETSFEKIPDNKNIFLTLFSSLILADWSSYYLALNYNQDPTPVDMVEEFKKSLK